MVGFKATRDNNEILTLESLGGKTFRKYLLEIMVRNHNTDINGNEWSEKTINNVWNKGKVIPDYSPDIWRWDICGKVMNLPEFGNRDSKHGWEIDHINPVSNGGTDIADNLQPLYWKDNADKGDVINWRCPSKGLNK